MSRRALVLTAASLGCFAANSLLARRALGARTIDPATFTLVRLAAGALVLPALALARGKRPAGGSWTSALALLIYAGAFSVAYLRVSAGPGALLLFAAVQATMLGWSVARGARPSALRWLGVVLALCGLAYLAPPGARGDVDGAGAALMLAAGVGWGVYSLRARTVLDPLATTAANFLRATVLALPVALAAAPGRHLSAAGLALAATSGAIASGLGYSLWYAAVPLLGPARAATVQLAVPVVTALAATALLGEPITIRLAFSAAAILGGVALTLRRAPLAPRALRGRPETQP